MKAIIYRWTKFHGIKILEFFFFFSLHSLRSLHEDFNVDRQGMESYIRHTRVKVNLYLRHHGRISFYVHKIQQHVKTSCTSISISQERQKKKRSQCRTWKWEWKKSFFMISFLYLRVICWAMLSLSLLPQCLLK